ncbi:TATA-box binding protein associated factor 12 [Oratosquilla oratoria]|uniref:TATA-box binding protein associated factor 12 n=1 Tax=Oratosquilla oratoria TaxID=337810 RepID=UPI003F75BFE6
MSQPVQQVVQGQVVQGQVVQGQIVQGQVVTAAQVVNSAGQQLMTQLVSGQTVVTTGQTIQGSVVHPVQSVGSQVTTLQPGQVVTGQQVQNVQGVQHVVQGQQQIQTVNHQNAVVGNLQPATQVKQVVQNQAVPAPNASASTSESWTPVLTKQRINELVREVDPNEQLDDDVEEMLFCIADDFIESTVDAACRLAKHRGGRTLDVKDIQLYLERTWHMWIPGFGTEELRPYKRAPTTEAHKQRLALIRKAIKKY